MWIALIADWWIKTPLVADWLIKTPLIADWFTCLLPPVYDVHVNMLFIVWIALTADWIKTPLIADWWTKTPLITDWLVFSPHM